MHYMSHNYFNCQSHIKLTLVLLYYSRRRRIAAAVPNIRGSESEIQGLLRHRQGRICQVLSHSCKYYLLSFQFLTLIFSCRASGDTASSIRWRISPPTITSPSKNSLNRWVSHKIINLSLTNAFFLISLGIFCRSNNTELDENIFKIFDLGKTEFVDEEELTMMLINFPDIGFSNPQNIN